MYSLQAYLTRQKQWSLKRMCDLSFTVYSHALYDGTENVSKQVNDLSFTVHSHALQDGTENVSKQVCDLSFTVYSHAL